jgi:sporulation protein YlmC with PRC-barrel domain
MSSRILMTTVAAIALALPALAQDQGKPLETGREPAQQLEQPKEMLQEQTGQSAADTTAPAERLEPPPVTAQEPSPATAPGEPARAAEEQATPPAEMQFLAVQDKSQFLAKEEVIGKDVVNVMDEKVGTVADLVMDQDQKLVGAVLSVGGFLGIGEKWVAVPVDQIDFPSEDQPARLRIAVTEQQLKNAPDFLTREQVEAQAEVDQTQQQATEQHQIPSPTPTTRQ